MATAAEVKDHGTASTSVAPAPATEVPRLHSPLNDAQRALVEKKLEILRQASFGFTQDRLLHIQEEDLKTWTDACTAELRRKIVSVAPSHIKITLIDFRKLRCVSLQCFPLWMPAKLPDFPSGYAAGGSYGRERRGDQVIPDPVSDVRPLAPSASSRFIPSSSAVGSSLKFGRNSTFQVELRRRVDRYFRTTGRRERDCWQMYLKTTILVAGCAASYALLVFVAQTWLPALLLAILLGLSAAGIGLNTQHDGGHHAYSNYSWVNKLMAMTLDLIGGSSYLWHWKHVVFHHPYVNIAGHDTDINLGILARLTPHQKRLAFHRWQHLYLWPLYGLLAIKWQLFDDFRKLITGRIGVHRIPRPKKWDLVILVAGKAIFLTSAFGIPLLFHSVMVVLFYYGVAALVVGTVLSVVFQVAHCVEEADFPLPQKGNGRIDNAWAIHQAETTVDFARRSRVLAWLLGGLNFQIEHHLLPRISHVNYPAISKLVEETCRDFGVKYMEYKSFRAGIASHFRWLRRMGMPNPYLPG